MTLELRDLGGYPTYPFVLGCPVVGSAGSKVMGSVG